MTCADSGSTGRFIPEPVPPLEAVGSAGWLMGVATGESRRGLVATLEGHDLIDLFATTQTDDKAMGKPYLEMLLKAMNDVGSKKAHTVMIGDTTFDMKMARNAGALAVGVSWGYHNVEELRSAGADVVVTDFVDLLQTIKKLTE